MQEGDSARSSDARARQHPSIICEGNCSFTLPPSFDGDPTKPIETTESGIADQQQDDEAGSLDQLDLLAQERMAHWAFVAALMTAAGVWLVYLTLRAALDANMGFREAANRQLRAYVTLLHTKVFWEFGNGDDQIATRALVHLLVKNSGQTPARNVRIVSDNFYLPKERGGKPIAGDYADPDKHGPRTTLGAGGEIIAHAAWWDVADLIAHAQQGDTPIIYTRLLYEDVFGTPRRTEVCLQIANVRVPKKKSESATDADLSSVAYPRHNEDT